jgi:hypothetical protein
LNDLFVKPFLAEHHHYGELVREAEECQRSLLELKQLLLNVKEDVTSASDEHSQFLQTVDAGMERSSRPMNSLAIETKAAVRHMQRLVQFLQGCILPRVQELESQSAGEVAAVRGGPCLPRPSAAEAAAANLDLPPAAMTAQTTSANVVRQLV